MQREIDGLRMKRREVETTVESLVSTLNNTLEFIREQDARQRDERILLHRPRTETITSTRPASAADPFRAENQG